MVVRMLRPAVLVPDEQAWTMAGVDVRAAGFETAVSPEGASVLAGPERVPGELAAAVGEAWDLMPEPRRVEVLGDPFDPGVPLAEVLDVGRQGEHAGMDHGQHAGMDQTEHASTDHGEDEHAGMDHGQHAGMDHAPHAATNHGEVDHAGMDHADMMEITGDPSRDGLVMEPTDFALGPLSPALPTGLVAELSLDGDVVASCRVRATLRAGRDALTPRAWTAATRDLVAAERIVAVEVERALSHAAWLRRFAELLGWPLLADRAGDAVVALFAGAPGRIDFDAARRALAASGRLVESRAFRSRTAGRAVIDAAGALALGLTGPIARASGVPRDARSEDPAYADLGFEPVTRKAGDAAARTEVRAEEAVAALDLAQAALGADLPFAPSSTVEGPRGPISDGTTPGALEAVALAGGLVIGLEWSAALAALASFDLSPWNVTAPDPRRGHSHPHAIQEAAR